MEFDFYDKVEILENLWQHPLKGCEAYDDYVLDYSLHIALAAMIEHGWFGSPPNGSEAWIDEAFEALREHISKVDSSTSVVVPSSITREDLEQLLPQINCSTWIADLRQKFSS